MTTHGEVLPGAQVDKLDQCGQRYTSFKTGGTNVNKMMLPIVGAALSVVAAQNSLSAPAKSVSKQQIAHGEYLVKGIAGCSDCHTPMNEKGEPVQEKWLQGTKLFFAPTVPIPNWADTSPKALATVGGCPARSWRLEERRSG